MNRLIETNIAIIVGCMPAFAHIATRHLGSGFFRSLRSRLLGGSGQLSKHSGSGMSSEQANKPTLVTFGQNQTPRRKHRGLNDTSLLRSEGYTTLGPTRDEEHEMSSRPSSTRHEPEGQV
jgi:hypothetical protein